MNMLERLARRVGTGAEVALGVAFAGVIAFNTLLAARSSNGWPFTLGVGMAICATALLRAHGRAWTAAAGLGFVAVTGLAVALGAIPPAAGGPLFGGGLAGLLVLGAAATRTLAPRPAVLLGATGAAVIAASETAGPDGLFDQRALHALAGATLWAAALAVGVYLRYLDFLRRQALETVRREERLELARELHDVVAHHVTGMVVQAQAARFAGQERTGTLLSALASIESAGLDTLTATRRLVGLLRDPDDASGVLPGTEPISQLVRRFARHGPAVDLRLPADPQPPWPPDVASTVYRIVQEGLTNIARHAAGARSVAVTVTVTHDAQQVRVEVTDDAPAPAPRHPRPSGGYGAGMRERVEALGGKVRVGPLPSAGWAVQASLPVTAHSRP